MQRLRKLASLAPRHYPAAAFRGMPAMTKFRPVFGTMVPNRMFSNSDKQDFEGIY
jgi:hypothetical protein